MSKHASIFTDGSGHGHDQTPEAGWGLYAEIDNMHVDQYGPCVGDPTNNRGELMGLYFAYLLILDKGLTTAELVLDSKYVLDSVNKYLPGWIKRNWIKSNLEPVKNADLWKLVAALKPKVDATCKISYRWVKSHTGDYGNERADDNAALGKAIYVNRESDDIAKAIVTVETPIETAESAISLIGQLTKDTPAKEPKAKRVKKAKLPVPNRLIALHRMIDVTGDREDDSPMRRYFVTKFDDKDKVKSRNCGVPSGDTCEGVVICPVDPFIEMIHQKQTNLSGTEARVPYLIQTDVLLAGKAWEQMVNPEKNDRIDVDKFGSLHITVPKDVKKMEPEDEWITNRITHMLHEPRCALDCLENLTLLSATLSSVLAGAKNIVKYDITDLFINRTDKPKLVDNLAKTVSVNTTVEVAGREFTIVLTSGTDMPVFSKFLQILKQEPELKISIVIHEVTNLTFRYSVLLEGFTSIALFAGTHSNTVFMTTS